MGEEQAIMTDEQLLRPLGEALGWTFWEDTRANLPHPQTVLEDALSGKRGPIFWRCFNPDGGVLFLLAKPGATRTVLWKPLEDAEQREEILAAVRSLGGKVSVHAGGISVEPVVDGYRTLYTGDSPRRICEAALAALSTSPELPYD